MSVDNLNDVQDMRPRLRSSIIPYSEEHITTFDMGWLIPHHWLYNVPGDKMNIGHSAFFRFDPFLNPILSRVKAKNYDFQVPRRILYNEREFEKWFTGGVNDCDADKLLPHFTFKAFYKFCYDSGGQTASETGGLFGFNTLCDYLGLPVNQCYVPAVVDSSTGVVTTPAHFLDPDDVLNDSPINIELFLAYALIYREYFLWNHSEQSIWVTNKYLEDFTKIPFMCLDSLVDPDDSAYDEEFVVFMYTILSLKHKGWNHDYFTSALPNIQAGDPAMVNIGLGDSLEGVIRMNNGNPIFAATNLNNGNNPLQFQKVDFSGENLGTTNVGYDIQVNNDGTGIVLANGVASPNGTVAGPGNVHSIFSNGGTIKFLNNFPVKISQIENGTSGFTMNDLRLLNAIQVFKERQNLGGARLKEALYMQFGVTVPDDRLDRPDFVGYMDFPVQISEVLQTSETTDTSVLGDQGGHGIAAGTNQTVHNYFVLEPMISISIMCVLPDSYYCQGMSPFFNKISKFDEWNPVFNHLSDQAVYNDEIYFDPTRSTSDSEFGYLPRFAEYKCRYNRISGNLRKVDSGMMSWHQARIFSSLPILGQGFINSHPTERIFAVVDNDQEDDFDQSIEDTLARQENTHCVGVINNAVKLSRNIPSGSDPSLNID